MRIAIGGLHHETNSFSNIPITKAILDRALVGENLRATMGGVRNYVGGFFAAGEELGVEVVPTVMGYCTPSGHITKEAMEIHRDRIVEAMWAAHQEKPLDAIALNLHGAGVADDYHDADAEILRAVRERFGADMPIGIAMDLHANIDDPLVAMANTVVGVKGYPHVDMFETGIIVFKQLVEMVKTGTRPAIGLARLPWLIAPAEGVTTSGPAHDVQQLCYRKEEEVEKLMAATFFQGFPYADVAECAVTVVTVAEDQETADKVAHDIATYAWNRRRDFAVPANSAEKAFDLAMQLDNSKAPIVINESSDNTGGGGPGDGTHLVREMVKRNLPGSAYGYIYDPEVAAQAAKAGIGAKIDCMLGAKMDKLHGEPLELKGAYVKTISDGVFINQSPMGGGGRTNLGLTVCLEVGNVCVIVGSNRTQPMDDGVFRVAGLRWDLLKYVALKSSQHFKGWWLERAGGIVPCDSPGIHCADLKVFNFENTNTTYFPLGDPEWK
ncbi:MAG: M81 family metallopeptidase [Oscillospiraceae bacterium]|nr:M81 family metallopeptidase [Oscillospiraceae bacterium]